MLHLIMWLLDYFCYLDNYYLIMNMLPTIKSKMQLNQCQLLSLMNPWLYLLSTICAHSRNFPTPQLMQMMTIGMRTIDMSIRFEVNQSTFVPMWSFHRESYLFLLSLLYKTMWFIIVLLCNKHYNDTFEICLIMCVTVSGAHMSLLCILFCY